MILYILYEVSHVRDPVLIRSQGGTGEGKVLIIIFTITLISISLQIMLFMFHNT